MSAKSLSGRAIKRRIYELLQSPDRASALNEIGKLPRRQVINQLFSFLHNRDQDVRWAAVKAMGTVVSELADEDTIEETDLKENQQLTGKVKAGKLSQLDDEPSGVEGDTGPNLVC